MSLQSRNFLIEHNKTIAAAESFTGGWFAKLITAKPGASKYFKGSIVCYTEDAKINVLGIDEQFLKTYKTISKEVALEMAIKATEKFHTNYGFGFTGNAGPTSSDDQEIGLVYVAVYNSDTKVSKTIELLLNDEEREDIQKIASKIAFNALMEVL